MPRLVSLTLLSMLALPVMVLAFILTMGFCYEVLGMSWGQETTIMSVSSLAAYASLVSVWLLIWHNSIVWNALRIARTVLTTVLICPVIGGIGGLLGNAVFDWGMEGIIVFGAGVAAMAWWVAVAFLWRQTPAERAAAIGQVVGVSGTGPSVVAVHCPDCNYILNGLHESRCPECGGRFTLDQLQAAQPGREASELADR